MKTLDFLQHYGLVANPFSEEDAQTDPVFKESCIKTTRHPAWDKLYGSPLIPSTSLVFGEKGSGKTALRLQMIRELTQFNSDHLADRPFVIDHSDLNPYLDRFQSRHPRRWKPAKLLAHIEMADHLDAILSSGLTQLVDRIVSPTESIHPAAVDPTPLELTQLNRNQLRDLLAMTIVYDKSRGESPLARFNSLAKKGKFFSWKSWANTLKEFSIGVLGTIFLPAIFLKVGIFWDKLVWLLLGIFILWSFWLFKVLARYWRARRVRKSVRVLDAEVSQLFSAFMALPLSDYLSIPLPQGRNQEKRYDLLGRLISVLNTLDFNGMIVLMDRIDEPYLINGSPELMKSVIWPLLDNKLLKHEHFGIKALLPDDLYRFMQKETEAFHSRCRQDKQNLIPSLSWTGESLMDLVNARIAACYHGHGKTTINDFFVPAVTEYRLCNAFAELKVPRHLLKFLNELLISHLNSCTEENPVWTISEPLFERTFAEYRTKRDIAQIR